MNSFHLPNVRRRWCQFSVHTVLIAVLVLSLFLSWLRVRAARNRQTLAELHSVSSEISSLGGDIDCRYTERRPNWLERLMGDPGEFDVTRVSLGLARKADLQSLRCINGMLHSWELGLSRSGVPDAALKHLQTLTGLRELDLSTTEITDAGLKHLHGLASLRVLRLENTHVTAVGISDLQEALPNARIIPSPRHLTAIAEIKKAGGTFYWRSPRVTIFFSRVLHLDITDAVLGHIEAFADLEEQMDLDLTGTQISDVGLEPLERLTQLRTLMLGNTQITDAGLQHLKQLSQLEYLGLHETHVTDAALVHLKGLTSLGWLNLHNTQVTDAGLNHLAGLTRLSFLDISDTQVTDGGLVHLRELTRLRSLTLRATSVTGDGTWYLQQALPKCRIRR